MDKIIVVGGGGHAKVIINTIKKLYSFEILGYLDLINNGPLLGVKYLGSDDLLPELFARDNKCCAVVAFGGVTISDKRILIYQRLKEIGFRLPVIISDKALIGEDVKIGEGSVVLDSAVINPGCIIGRCVIINNAAILDYNCVIEDFVHLTPKTRVSHSVKIGYNSFIGTGSIINRNVEVLDNCFIAAGAVLNSGTISKGKYIGFPAALKTIPGILNQVENE